MSKKKKIGEEERRKEKAREGKSREDRKHYTAGCKSANGDSKANECLRQLRETKDPTGKRGTHIDHQHRQGKGREKKPESHHSPFDC